MNPKVQKISGILVMVILDGWVCYVITGCGIVI